MAAVYTHGHHESVLRSHRWRTAANSAAYLLPHLTPGLSLLDIGCGPGTITADLAARVAPGRVTAVEVTDTALGLARAEAAARGQTNIEFVVSDVHALDIPDAPFDVVHAHQLLQHVTDPVSALREMRRVCRPGGIVAARDSDYAAKTWFPAIPELAEWQTLYRRVARANGGEPDAGRRLLSWARAAGFTQVTATSATWCFATPEDRAWWGGLWADRVVQSDIAGHAVASGMATPADLLRIAAGWRRWAAADDGWLSVLHGEILCRA
jgi:ubiquinone/menaquinone biosynthesis C-methylase UbiE